MVNFVDENHMNHVLIDNCLSRTQVRSNPGAFQNNNCLQGTQSLIGT